MIIFLKPMILASFTTILAIYILRPFAVNIKLLDFPSGRKQHEGNIPLIGGISIFLGLIVSILMSPADLNDFNYFIFASLILLIIGVIDDHSNMTVSYRLIFQFIAATIMVTAGGQSIESIGDLFGYGEVTLNEWSMIISILAVITGINAVNMTDGIHGLAGGSSLVSFLAISILAINSTSQISLLISLLFCAVLPIFLINNLCIGIPSNKRIFLGDAGSMFIGLSLTWVLFDFSQGEGRSFSPALALWLFAFPLIEMASSVLRRVSNGISPFKPDSSHLHHLLLKLGISEKKTLIILIIFSTMMAVIGVLCEWYGAPEYLMFIIFLAIFMAYFFTGKLVLKKVNKLNQKYD